MFSIGWAANGSSTAVAASGIRVMSDLLIAFQPAIEEPSNMMPSVKDSSSMVQMLRGMVHLAARVGEAKVDVLDVVFLDQVEDLADVRHASDPFSMVDAGSPPLLAR